MHPKSKRPSEGPIKRVSKRPIEWPTLVVLVLTYTVWATGTMMWQHSALLSVILTAIAIAQHSSLQHEALHDHPFRNATVNEALVFPALSVVIPYQRFRDLHLQHHYDPNLTDPYDDPESNYLDPANWNRLTPTVQMVLRWNNTLAGRMAIGPALSTFYFLESEAKRALHGDRQVIKAWLLHLAGLAMVIVWLMIWGTMPIWSYMISVYLALALLRIRTFLEHRAHDASRARTVVIEDRGPLALLFLNNNFHVVHHMHPNVPWYQLPGLYASRRAHFLRRNDSYVYRNYRQIFLSYFLTAKDPVSHPVWPVKKAGPSDDC